MSQSSSRFIEDEQQDQQSLATNGMLTPQNTERSHSITERAKKLQDMLALQQQRLRNQHLLLLSLEELLKRQARKVSHRALLRKTILLGMGNAQEATVLMEGMEHAGAHRVFVAADRSQVLCVLRTVHIDLLVLDEALFPLPGSELDDQWHCVKEKLPAIILSTHSRTLLPKEYMSPNLIGLEQPMTVESVVMALHHLLSKQNGST